MDYLTEKRHVGEPLAVHGTATGLFELARHAGFDTYEDFVRWRRENPDEYERWYAGLHLRR
jgi:hypothetical protein